MVVVLVGVWIEVDCIGVDVVDFFEYVVFCVFVDCDD